MRTGQGNPDEARSARYILKDYVNGKLLFAQPPPGISKEVFNHQTHQLALKRARNKKHAPTTRVGRGASTYVSLSIPTSSKQDSILPALQGLKSRTVDHEFFENNSRLPMRPFVQGSARNGQHFTRARMFPHQNTVADDGRTLDRATTQITVGTDKKHHKKGKRVKQRSGQGYD
jgi:large subunit GTPase 1